MLRRFPIQCHRRQSALAELGARLEPEVIELLTELDTSETEAQQAFHAAYGRLEEIFTKRFADWRQEMRSFEEASKVKSWTVCQHCPSAYPSLSVCLSTCQSVLLFVCNQFRKIWGLTHETSIGSCHS